jgi:hypothetical protein
MPKTLPKAPKNKKPPLKFQPPVKPKEEHQKKIDVLEAYLLQLQNRGAPESELLAERQKIEQEKLKLSLMSD